MNAELLSKINKLEKEAMVLEPNKNQRDEWLLQVQTYCDKFIDNIDINKTFIKDLPDNFFKTSNIKDDPENLKTCLDILEKHVDYIGLNPASGGHMGYIPGGGIYTTALGDFMADITNRYAGIFFGGPGAVRMENMLIDWTAKLINYPKGALGNLTSGGSIANLIAITTARDAKNIKSHNITKSVIYMTSHTHHCVDKAIRIAGLSETIIRRIPLDKSFRIDTDALEQLLKDDKSAGLNPFLVVATIGTTDVGAVDNIEKIGKLTKAYDTWFHIDAAYGGYFILVDELKERFKGVESSDSLVIDPHKSLFLSYGTGIVLVKDGKKLHESHYYKANYMKDAIANATVPSPADLSPELTKHFRGLRFWLSLKLFGLKPFKAGLLEKHLLCKYFHSAIESRGFIVGPKPELSVCIYKYKTSQIDSNAFNERLVENIHADGRVFVSSTTIDGEIWLRMAILAFRTHKYHIDKCIDMLMDGVEKTKLELY